MKNLEKIKKEALAYVEEYIAHMNKSKTMHEAEFKRKYGYSTLRYFHKELGVL